MFKQFLFRIAAVTAMVCFSATAMAEGKVIKIGSHLPLTGGLARTGLDYIDGIQVAIQHANENYQGEYRFELLSIDDESTPEKAVAAVERLASQGVVALTGGYGSNIVGPASGAAHELGIPYITSGAMAIGLTQRGYNDFFSTTSLFGYSRAMAGVSDMVGASKVSIVYNNAESTTDLARETKKELDKLGITSVMHGYEGNTSNFTPLVNRIRLQDRPDVIVMVGYENDYVAIMRAARVLKPDVKAMVGAWSLATEVLNREFNDVVQGSSGPAVLPHPIRFTDDESLRFARTFEEMHGKIPDYVSQFGYLQTTFMVDAIVRAGRAGEIMGETIAREMHATDVQTPVGRVAFDETGANPHFTLPIGQHQGDRIELVWPESSATGEMVQPGRSW